MKIFRLNMILIIVFHCRALRACGQVATKVLVPEERGQRGRLQRYWGGEGFVKCHLPKALTSGFTSECPFCIAPVVTLKAPVVTLMAPVAPIVTEAAGKKHTGKPHFGSYKRRVLASGGRRSALRSRPLPSCAHSVST